MTVVWLIILILLGLVNGFNNIPLIGWLLLIPFIYEDAWDVRHQK
jgi:hypothetical protein